MRLVVDFQGAQGESRVRGIGRYSVALVRAIVRNRGQHEIVLALSGAFPETVDDIRNEFASVLGEENIRVWDHIGDTAAVKGVNSWRARAMEQVREYFIQSLEPDAVLVTSLFDGYGDEVVTSVGTGGHIPTATVLYDLIPLVFRDEYLHNQDQEAWYFRKLGHLSRSDLLLGISQSACDDAAELLGVEPARLVNIAGAADASFRRLNDDFGWTEQLSALGIYGSFVLCTGGIEPRKNLRRTIEAFGQLPEALREGHLLVIVWQAGDYERGLIRDWAEDAGIRDGLVVTGYVSDETLVMLYNACKLFIAPSLYEGFGLPALEAMQCGAPVIASNTSSFLEVIGTDEALFDPHSVRSIERALERALLDDAFRERLKAWGRDRPARFTWDQTALRALESIDALGSLSDPRLPLLAKSMDRPRLAIVFTQHGSNWSLNQQRQLLVSELSDHYEITVVVPPGLDHSFLPANFPIRTRRWLRRHSQQVDRILYDVATSNVGPDILSLVEDVPGVVLLRDSLAPGIADLRSSRSWSKAFYDSFGYSELVEALRGGKADCRTSSCALPILNSAMGVIVPSGHVQTAIELSHGQIDGLEFTVVPPALRAHGRTARSAARTSLGLDPEILVVALVSEGAEDLRSRTSDVWRSSTLAASASHKLVILTDGSGPAGDGPKDDELNRVSTRLDFQRYLAAADIIVLLSNAPTSPGDAQFDALGCCVSTISNSLQSNEAWRDAVLELPLDFSDDQLRSALEQLASDAILRGDYKRRAEEVARREHLPSVFAQRVFEFVERSYNRRDISPIAIARSVARLAEPSTLADSEAFANVVARTFPPRAGKRQVLVDVSELSRRDAATGIQRVVKQILKEVLKSPPSGYRLEPVYFDGTVYRYARNFISRFASVPSVGSDDAVDFRRGDLFLGLDLDMLAVRNNASFYQGIRALGVRVWFVVYDILCVRMPHHFAGPMEQYFKEWLPVIGLADGLACISQAVADDVRDWYGSHPLSTGRLPEIQAFHLGADFRPQGSSLAPGERAALMSRFEGRPTFLMVGTIESRKGHRQVINAFEALWNDGHNVNLVLVGKAGWLVEDVIVRLRRHPQTGQRLFWFESLSDEELAAIYEASTCLIAASEGEGFGLPLVEAAHHGLPVLARDLPVFKEVAGEHAAYFSGLAAADLARAVEAWLELDRAGLAPQSVGIKALTWRESAEQLIRMAAKNGCS